MHPNSTIGTQSFNQQRKSQSHHLRSWIFEGAREMVSSEPQLNSELRERLRDRPSYSALLDQKKLRPIILNWRKQGNPWNGTILYLPRRKNSKSLHRWAQSDHCLLGLWRSNSSGCNAERGDNFELWSFNQDAVRTPEEFQEFGLTRLTEILLQHVNARLQKNLKTLEAIIKYGVTVLHQQHFSPNLAPSHFHLFGALKDTIHSMKSETDDDVTHAVRI